MQNAPTAYIDPTGMTSYQTWGDDIKIEPEDFDSEDDGFWNWPGGAVDDSSWRNPRSSSSSLITNPIYIAGHGMVDLMRPLSSPAATGTEGNETAQGKETKLWTRAEVIAEFMRRVWPPECREGITGDYLRAAIGALYDALVIWELNGGKFYYYGRKRFGVWVSGYNDFFNKFFDTIEQIYITQDPSSQVTKLVYYKDSTGKVQVRQGKGFKLSRSLFKAGRYRGKPLPAAVKTIAKTIFHETQHWAVRPGDEQLFREQGIETVPHSDMRKNEPYGDPKYDTTKWGWFNTFFREYGEVISHYLDEALE